MKNTHKLCSTSFLEVGIKSCPKKQTEIGGFQILSLDKNP